MGHLLSPKEDALNLMYTYQNNLFAKKTKGDFWEMYRCEDKERLPLWKKLEEKTGADVADAIKELYDVYDVKMVDWTASLYDPEVGGFYASISGRDTDGYLPDIISTLDGIGFASNYMVIDKPYQEVIPEWLKKRVGDFVLSIQDKNGYFYHPQYPKGVAIPAREALDLNVATRIMRAFGLTPKYPMPLPTADNKDNNEEYIPEKYQSVENYKAYLAEQDIEHRSYHVASAMLSFWGQTESYGKRLGVDLVKMTTDFLLEHLKENGTFQDEVNDYAINGMYKAYRVIGGNGIAFPYPEAAIKSAFEVIMSEKIPDGITSVYNPWHAVALVLENARKYYDKERADKLLQYTYSLAVDGIRRTRDKIAVYKKPDGALSYCPNYCVPVNHMLPTSVEKTYESDMNGTSCGCIALIESVFRALELDEYRIPLFPMSECDRFFALLMERENNWIKYAKK